MNKGEILHKDLCYKIQGILMETRRLYGPGHKEIVYCNSVEELLNINHITHKREVSIKAYSLISGKVIGYYKPDFIIDDKVIIEAKAVDYVPKNYIDQLYSYLRVSQYEVGLFVNFRSPELYIKRIIFTNDRKHEIIRKSIVN